LDRGELATLLDTTIREEELQMRRLIVSVAVAASCALVSGSLAWAGHYENWSEAEQAEHQRRASVEPPPSIQQPSIQQRREVAPSVTTLERWSEGADEYDDSQSHPLRLLAYVIHPVGYTLEWLVTRPFHEFVAQPDLEPVFGHQPHAYYGESPFGARGWTAGRGVHVDQ
jgi:hypothetical protein